MEHLSNISRIHNCLNQFGTEYEVWDIFLLHFFSCGQQLKTTKYPREKIWDPQNTHEKIFGPMKYVRRLDVTLAQDTRDSDVTWPTKFSTLSVSYIHYVTQHNAPFNDFSFNEASCSVIFRMRLERHFSL